VHAMLERRDDDGAPPIRGVIHAAGVTESRLLNEMTDTTLAYTMWPKIAGAEALQSAFPPGVLDFFFLIASAGTVFGVPGQGAYAAANSYLDCLARTRHREGCRTVSLDWSAWQGLGFAAEAEVVVEELRRVGSRPISSEEAFAAWDYVNRYDAAQVVIAPMSTAANETTADAVEAPGRAWSEMSQATVRIELEGALIAIVAGELGVADGQLALDRPFAELGLNSVMAMSIRREAEQLVGIELSATMLWNHPTITSLAEYLAGKLTPEGVAAEAVDETSEDAGSVLDSLFDSVESA
jgi:phthiocerol/phenolphthiocerol synthesis type-I polyketide synthase A